VVNSEQVPKKDKKKKNPSEPSVCPYMLGEEPPAGDAIWSGTYARVFLSLSSETIQDNKTNC